MQGEHPSAPVGSNRVRVRAAFQKKCKGCSLVVVFAMSMLGSTACGDVRELTINCLIRMFCASNRNTTEQNSAQTVKFSEHTYT